MSNVVRSSFQAASQELIARLVKSGYLEPALRNDPDAITIAIARLKEDLRGGGRRQSCRTRPNSSLNGSRRVLRKRRGIFCATVAILLQMRSCFRFQTNV
jgi:hypothetical protein